MQFLLLMISLRLLLPLVNFITGELLSVSLLLLSRLQNEFAYARDHTIRNIYR